MKKITLLLLVLLTAVGGAKAGQTTIFKGEFSSGYWLYMTLNKELFTNAKEGDVLYIKWTLDKDAAIAYDGSEDKAYYQFNISFPYDKWEDKLVTNTDVKYTATHYAVTLTSEQVTKLQTHGIAISARFLNITDVVIGDAFSKTEVKYWNGNYNDWKSASEANIEMPAKTGDESWNSCVLNGETIKSAKIGDRLTVTFTPGSSSLWDAQLQIKDAATDWLTLMGIPVGGLTNMSLLVDEAIYTSFQKGDIRLQGVNLTITNIQLETTSLCYRLSAYDTNVDITKLPTATTVNVELYREFDYNTSLCVPFNIANVRAAFGSSAKAYEFKEYNIGSGLVFTEREHIEAGKPYFMEFGDGDKDKTTISFENVTINAASNNSEESNGLTFKGNYTPAMDMVGKYGVACVQNGDDWVWGFYKGGSGSTLNAYSAYFDGSGPAARLGIFLDENEVLGITSVNSKADNVNNEYYNLAGQRVEKPAKGLYIVNGKKYVIK